MSLKQQILTYSRQETIASLSAWFDTRLEHLIDQNFYADQNVLENTGQKLVQGLKNYSTKYSINNVAIGMSGGVDSALTAALFKSAGWTVTGVTMPIHQNPSETERGIAACQALGINHVHVDLTNTYDDLVRKISSWDSEINNTDHVIRRANLRVRLRMITVYNIASSLQGLVGSTDNFSELAAGFWTLHGDVGDLAPIQSLNKSWEVPKLAEIYGVPASTVFAKPTDGLGISDGDEAQFGFSYLEFDIVLLTLCNTTNLQTREEILKYLSPGSNISKVNKILDRIKFSTFKRTNPYNLDHPQDPNRYFGLKNIDAALWKKL
jgi:nicotinamide-nucleotide amidase